MPERAPEPFKVNNFMGNKSYFLFNIQIRLLMWEKLRLSEALLDMQATGVVPEIVMIRRLADRLNRQPEQSERPVPAGHLHLYGLMNKVYRHIIDRFTEEIRPRILEDALESAGFALSSHRMQDAAMRFAELFPGAEIVSGKASAEGYVADDDVSGARKKELVKEMLLLSLAGENPALDSFRQILDDSELAATSEYRKITTSLDSWFATAPPLPPFGVSLMQLLRAPLMASPRSLAGQAEYIRSHWLEFLPSELLADFLTAIDIVHEEEQEFHGGPGRPMVLEFLKGRFGYEYPEYDRFSPDSEWMPNVIMIAKMAYVWLGQLTKKYGRPVERLDQVPDEELDRLARWGFTALWLIGLWDRSPASALIKRISGNTEAAASAYSLFDYVIAPDLGGDEALGNLKERCQARGIRLASDMVPNHTGIYSRWIVEHPDWFIQLEYPPYPAYSFNGPDLTFSPEISINIDDGYWEQRDAAVVFKHYDHRDGRTRYIYHGNDGTSTPWNDTAQLNYLLPEVREAVIRTILHVARQFPIIRFDAAMTLAKKHYQRLWYPQPGHGSGVPSRAERGMSREEFDKVFPEEFWREVVDRVAAEAPGTLLLAEAFWLMEGYFVRTLGMHRVYNSAFMNMLKMEENDKYRQTVKNVLEYDHRILQRFVNFMNNPDERTAVEQFGKEGKYFGACVLLVTMPGLPMIGHGQIEGFHEKYGMEYQRACWDEAEDEHLVAGHEAKIFPLMGRRRLFSGSENFTFYDFFSGGDVDENVFAYSNGFGGEHGLILYHNCYADTSGWIRTSTAIACKNDKGETILVQKSLGEALGCKPDGRYYYSFRDYSTGMEYLRSGPEICEKGLYAELGGYEYRAFLDFREICDDDFGSWGKLCARLNGMAVASLAEELKQVSYGAVIEAFRETVLAVTRCLATPLEDEEKKQLRSTIERFYDELNRNTACSGDCRALTDGTMREIDAVHCLREFDAGDEAPEFTTAPDTYADRLLLAAWLVLHGAGKLAVVDEHHMVIVSWIGELGLERAFKELATKVPEETEASPIGVEVMALLLRPLLRWQNFFAGWEMKEASTRFTLLFADPGAREFLECNSYEDHEWFKRERFALLLRWLAVIEVISHAAKEEPGHLTTASDVDLLGESSHKLMAVADAAGYRVDRFLELLQTSAKA